MTCDYAHVSSATWKPWNTNTLSRVNAATAPNCKNGAVACQEPDTHTSETHTFGTAHQFTSSRSLNVARQTYIQHKESRETTPTTQNQQRAR
ncbi:hypothetical protein EYF80_038959 [Liparis tanakae]|uniref:Uncharacterized protein n=1 Tax=Liparis tanakae TaxID=230148 RepID=A0A4Z2GDR0_9TELE|nr:hypothetical protein EYF80_038959 [Liparis tanakae]